MTAVDEAVTGPASPDSVSGTDSTTLVSLRNVGKSFDVSPPFLTRILDRKPVKHLHAVSDVTLEIARGRTLGLVGESGCGKSTLARTVAGLLTPTTGVVTYDGQTISDRPAAAQPTAIRRQIQMIFQDPFASLNPRWRIGGTIGDPLLAFGLARNRRHAADLVADLLREVGLSPDDRSKYPHAFSGGQRQRIAIARALASRPAFIICDEPTSALDVSVQAQILNLMRDLQDRLALTYLFISHNLAVIDHMADIVGVMYLGRIVELRQTDALFRTPRHPYTRMLIDTVPSLKSVGRDSKPMAGEVPSPLDPPSGCPFHPRCPLATDRCRAERPLPRPVEGGTVACHEA